MILPIQNADVVKETAIPDCVVVVVLCVCVGGGGGGGECFLGFCLGFNILCV